MKTAGSSAYPVIRRYTPYAPQTSRATSAPATSAPFSNQDLAGQLLFAQQQRQATIPSSNFQDTYNYDPIQTQIQALGAQSVANAQTNAAQLRKQAAITEGDPDLLRSLGMDETTISAASGNPESLLAQLNKDYSVRQKQLEESMNNQNLFYSGEYQNNLKNLATGQASAQASLGERLRELLSGIDTGVLGSQESARQAALQQQLDAQSAANTAAILAALGVTPPPPPPPPIDPNVPLRSTGLASLPSYTTGPNGTGDTFLNPGGLNQTLSTLSSPTLRYY